MRIREFGESDLLVTCFTLEKGLLKGIAKGGRRSRKRFVNCLDRFSLVNLEYEPKGNRELCFLHSCKLVNGFSGLRRDFTTLSLASYMIELTEILFPSGVREKEAFELLRSSFFDLDEGGNLDEVRVMFEGKAMALGGYRINLSRCMRCGRKYNGEGRAVFLDTQGGLACLKCEQETAVTPGLGPETVACLKTIQSSEKQGQGSPTINGRTIRELKPVLKRHVEYRLGRRLKTSEYLD